MKEKQKNLTNRVISTLLSFMMIFTLCMPSTVYAANTNETTPETVETTVETTTETVEITVGETIQLHAPKNNVTWESSDEEIVTVSKKGEITGVAIGEATVTAKTKSPGQIKQGKATVTEFNVVVKSKDTNTDVVLNNFKADKEEIYLNTEEKIVFTVEVGCETQINSSVEVVDAENHLIGNMNDSGVDGDEIANDGIYSCQVIVNESEIKTVTYYAKVGTVVSEEYEILFYRDLTKEEFSSFTELLNQIGEMSFEEAKEFITNSNEIKMYEIDEEHRTIAYQSIYGLYGIWEGTFGNNVKGNGELAIPKSEGLDYTMAEEIISEANITSSLSNKNILVLRPFRSTEFQYDDFSEAGTLLSHALESDLQVVDDEAVTLDVIKTVGDYGIVLVDSHGTVNNSKQYMITGEVLDEDKFLWDPVYYLKHSKYSKDYLSGRIYCVSFRNDDGILFNRVGVGEKYFKKYLSSGSLNDSLYYLGTCYSMMNNSIANVLTSKGASAVVGFTNVVSTTYCNEVLFELLVNSMVLSADTFGNGLSCARDFYGSRDPYMFAYDGTITNIASAGNNSYKIVDSISIDKNGTLSGKICKASDRLTPVGGATISIYRNDNIYRTVSADETGNYTINLPVGEYRIEITADGYISFSSYASVVENNNTYMETFLMIEGSEEETGIANGKIYNAITGTGIEGVSLQIRRGWNNTEIGEIISTITTDINGDYTVDLPLGNYTMSAAHEGYISSTVNIIVQQGTTSSQNGTMTPIGSGDSFRIVLTWGENPSDLDSHVVGTLSNGNAFHTYYGRKSQYDGDVEVCNLDVDDTTSYGPETVTVNTTVEQPYYYYIYRYSGSGTVASSGAQIKVYQGDVQIATFNVPTDQGSGDYWNAFAIVNGELVVRNTITSSAEINYGITNTNLRRALNINLEEDNIEKTMLPSE